MKKKILSMILATTMILGASMTVFAADEPNITDVSGAAGGQEITGSSTVNAPVIKVTVPTTSDIIINPYKITYKDEEAGITANSQIISAEQTITSESNVALQVNVSGLTTTGVSDTVTISASDITEKITDKSAFLYLEVIDGTSTFADAYNKENANQLVIPNVVEGSKVKAASKEAIVTLAAGDSAAQTAKFKIGGSVVANPMVEEEGSDEATLAPWTDSDTIGVSFKFTFIPQVATTE